MLNTDFLFEPLEDSSDGRRVWRYIRGSGWNGPVLRLDRAGFGNVQTGIVVSDVCRTAMGAVECTIIAAMVYGELDAGRTGVEY